MAARMFQLTLTAAAKKLSDVYGDGPSVVNPANDIPYRQLIFSSESQPSFIGDSSLTSSTVYGTRVEIGAAGSQPVSIGPFSDAGPIKLSQLWGAGTGTLHILGIPF